MSRFVGNLLFCAVIPDGQFSCTSKVALTILKYAASVELYCFITSSKVRPIDL